MKFKIYNIEELIAFIDKSYDMGYPMCLCFTPHWGPEGEMSFQLGLVSDKYHTGREKIVINGFPAVCYRFKMTSYLAISEIQYQSGVNVEDERGNIVDVIGEMTYEEAFSAYIENIEKEINNLLNKVVKKYEDESRSKCWPNRDK